MLRTVPTDPIFQAAASGDVEAIKACLVSNPNAVSQLDPDEQTLPILYAVQNKHVNAVQCLLEAGSPVDYVDIRRKKVMLDFAPNTKTGREIKRMLGKKMIARLKDWKWRASLSTYEESKSVSALLLNLIIYNSEKLGSKLIFDEFGKTVFTELANYVGGLNIHYAQYRSEKEWAEYLIFMGDVCARVGEVKEAAEYVTKAISGLNVALTKATTDEERIAYFTLLTIVYQNLLMLLQNENVQFEIIKTQRGNMSTHDLLQRNIDLASPWPDECADVLTAFNEAKIDYLSAYIRLSEKYGKIIDIYKCYHFFINSKIDWYEKPAEEKDKPLIFAGLAVYYKQLLWLLQYEFTTASAVKAIKESIATHNRLKEALSRFQAENPSLAERLQQLSKHVTNFFAEYARWCDLPESALPYPKEISPSQSTVKATSQYPSTFLHL